MRRHGLGIWILAAAAVRAAPAADAQVEVFRDEVLHWQEGAKEIVDDDGFVSRLAKQSVVRSVDLPAAPASPRDASHITVRVDVEPIVQTIDGVTRPNDPWTRLGNVTIETRAIGGETVDVELMRFITPFGGPASFEQDVTAMAPLLYGRREIRAFISTFSDDPGWTISVTLVYSDDGLGQRRPVFAAPLFADPHVHTESPRLTATVTIPPGLDPPRLRILSTGHATDGAARNEFMSCPHVLRIDGREIARWRPWSEQGGRLRDRNPWSGRNAVEGREIWSSDLDRTGWNPGLVVEPLLIPVPELTPGRHTVELEILGIRPKDPVPDDEGKYHHGYWVTGVCVVADEPWPMVDGTP